MLLWIAIVMRAKIFCSVLFVHSLYLVSQHLADEHLGKVNVILHRLSKVGFENRTVQNSMARWNSLLFYDIN